MSETDEIYERYLQRAIREINTLGEEIESCGRIAHPAPVPVLGSGHPLADVFLLKYRPQPAEVQEGVAFYGRAGAAVLKSLRRLGIDPMLIYGTNCVKCSDGDPDAAHAACPVWLLRELAIVEPRIVVVMGDEAVDVLNDLDVPLSTPLDGSLVGEVQPFTPTIEALVTPDIDGSLNDDESKRAFWRAFQALGRWHDALPPYYTAACSSRPVPGSQPHGWRGACSRPSSTPAATWRRS
jgi:uracil-DNA glycosylase